MTDKRPPVIILVIAGLFVATLAYLVAASFAPRKVATFEPMADTARNLSQPSNAIDTLTVDARAEGVWRFIDLDRRIAVHPPDTAGWDLAFMRHRIIAARGIRSLGPVDLSAIVAIDDTGFVENRTTGDTTNPAIERWYTYNFMTHLLEPAGGTYAARLGPKRFAVFQILSYYCPGPEAGCLTLRYTLR